MGDHVVGNHIAGSGWRPDGNVIYRRDGQRLIGVMPMHCKLGLHVLSAVGCVPRIVNRGYPYDDERLLKLTCPACQHDDTWNLVVSDTPEAAEWDDGPYSDIKPLLTYQPRKPT